MAREDEWDIEARNAAASKVSKKEEEADDDLNEDEDLLESDLVDRLQSLLDQWEEKDHPYFKDLEVIVREYDTDPDAEEDTYEEIAF